MAINNIKSLYLINGYHSNFKSEKTVLPAQKPDTVEISTKQKTSKESMSTGKKWLFGLAGGGTLLYAGLVGHRAYSRPALDVLQKDLSEIFRRNVSKEEIPGMLKKYQEIFKITDEKEFCQKAFEQVKKDYGYENFDIKLTISDDTNTIFSGQWMISGEAFILYYKNVIKYFEGKFDNLTKAKILDSIFHEFQHVKQTEYCMRTNPEKYYEALTSENVVNKTFRKQAYMLLENEELLKNNAKNMGMDIEQYKQALINDLEYLKAHGYKSMPPLVEKVNAHMINVKAHLSELFGGIKKFKPDSKEYELGEKYIKNFSSYIDAKKNSTNIEYMNQLVEKEAYNAENLSLGIPKRLKSVWNIFDNTNYDNLIQKRS